MLRLACCALLLAAAVGWVPAAPGRAGTAHRRRAVIVMGRRAAKNAARKGKSDAIKAKNSARIGKKIVMAVKAANGNTDPGTNSALAGAMAEARALSVPKANADAAIKRACAPDTASYKAGQFEAIGPGGVGLIIDVLTDNGNRANADISMTVKKSGLKIAAQGAVGFNFERKARLEVSGGPGALTEDALIDIAIEADIDDATLQTVPADEDANTDEQTLVFTEMEALGALRDGLAGAGYDVVSGLASVPLTYVSVTDDEYDTNMNCIHKLEELDDVDVIFHNMEDHDE